MIASFVPSFDVAGRVRNSAPLVSRDGARTVVWLDGEHDIATVFVLADVVARAISVDDADLIIDLSGVRFLGAATIHLLMRARDLLLERSRSLTLRSPSTWAQRVLELCGAASLIDANLVAGTHRAGSGAGALATWVAVPPTERAHQPVDAPLRVRVPNAETAAGHGAA